MGQTAILGGLFFAAFAAATIFPAQSEALLAALILRNDIPAWLLITVASAGNVLGSCLNWLLGRFIEKLKDRSWFPVNGTSLARAQASYQKYGRWSLLLSWVPFIGDPITVIAGVMREKFWMFLLFVSVAKAGRYIALAYLVASTAA
jgi:membrane protein YqaA with SNARE-associated domain